MFEFFNVALVHCPFTFPLAPSLSIFFPVEKILSLFLVLTNFAQYQLNKQRFEYNELLVIS